MSLVPRDAPPFCSLNMMTTFNLLVILKTSVSVCVDVGEPSSVVYSKPSKCCCHAKSDHHKQKSCVNCTGPLSLQLSICLHERAGKSETAQHMLQQHVIKQMRLERCLQFESKLRAFQISLRSCWFCGYLQLCLFSAVLQPILFTLQVGLGLQPLPP